MFRTTFVFLFLILGLLYGGVLAECPSEHDIPVMYNETSYLGCYYYVNGTAETAIQACYTTPNNYPEGYDFTTALGYTLSNHALVVRPGCIVYEFSDYDYQGSVTEFSAGVHPNVLSANKLYSFKVRCDIEHINCQPIDGYTTVLLCDALGAVVDSECKYIKTVGTAYTESITNSMSLDTGLQEEMSASFFGLFSTSLGVSVNTGYDWTQVSASTQGVQESFEVTAVAPAGYVLSIEQALGQCGGSEVRTELFRITQKNEDGTSTVKYVKAPGGKIPLLY